MTSISVDRFRFVAVVFAVAIGGCVQSVREPERPSHPVTPAKVTPGRFEPIAGRGPDTIAELRAGTAPAEPDFIDGDASPADERTFSSKGFVKVADGYYAGIDADAQAFLRKHGKAISADKVIIYTMPPDEATHAPSLHAVYYVRFKLPFGATFRDLTAAEQAAVGSTGIKIGSVVGGSPAADANLRIGDIVLAIDNNHVAGRTDFEKQCRSHMGKRVTLTISRDGNTSTRLVRLGILASELNRQ